jgi:putative hydrolase of the HAD superfamily
MAGADRRLACAARGPGGRVSAVAPREAGPLAGVRAVTFDLWLTLIRDRDSARVWQQRVDALAGVLGVDGRRARELLRTAYGVHRDAWDDGHALPLPLVADVLLRAAGRPPDPGLHRYVLESFDAPTSADGVELLPGAAEALISLPAAGLPVGLVCDTGFTSGAGLRRVLAGLGLLDAFTVLVFSDETRVPKPGARPFRAALAALGTAPAEAVHVGDLRRKDVVGARAVGMRTVRYRGAADDVDPEHPEADVVVDDHRRLLDLLGVPSVGRAHLGDVRGDLSSRPPGRGSSRPGPG